MRVEFHTTGRPDGDFAVGGDPDHLATRRAAVMTGPWTWLNQVHGADVVVVTVPGEHAGAMADAAVTAVPGAVLAVHTADCAPVVLDGGSVAGVAHAGWRGVRAGVLEATVAAMRDLGAHHIAARLGPTVRPGCYEFGEPELSEMVDRLGPAVRSRTADGHPALDVPAAVEEALARLGIALDDPGACSACDPRRWFSHRARGDTGRMATVARIVP